MAVSFVRSHGTAKITTAGSSVNISLVADVPAGNALILFVAHDNLTPGGTELWSYTVASGETRAWYPVTVSGSGGFTAGGNVVTRITSILTSVRSAPGRA